MSRVRVRPLTGRALQTVTEDLARLRIDVFRDWPYLYDGDLDYERSYVQHYADSPEAIIVGAFDGDWLVGAATATPLRDHASEFGDGLTNSKISMDRTFYCGESVLLPRYRGQGLGHVFFDQREEHARAKGYGFMCFCAVLRPPDHPLRPDDYHPLDPFWERRGYARVQGAVAQFAWKDVDKVRETAKSLQFWMRPL